MTTPTPTEQFNASYGNLQNELRSLQSKIHMSDARDAMGDMDTRFKSLPQAVKDLRNRIYVFEMGLEGQAAEIVQRWSSIQPSVSVFIEQQATQLEMAIRPIEAKMGYLTGQMSNPEYVLGLVKEVEADIENLQNKVSGAVSTASAMYSELAGQFQILTRHITDLNYTFDQIDQASFRLLPTEAAIMAIKATWTRDNREDRDDPQGVLYLTDQRLIFEQKQELATKKVLFIITERKLVQQMQLEFAVDRVADVKGTKQGIFKNEDFLDLTLATGAPVKSTQFHIFGQDCQYWVGLINRVRTHEFDKDRVIRVDQVEVEKVKNAPTICTSCGGVLPTVILRGQDVITCEYCGFVIRL